MNLIIMDSSSIISLAMNSLLYLLKKMKKPSVKFVITGDVKKEVVEVPLHIKKYGLEALMIQQLLSEGILEMPEAIKINPAEIAIERQKLMDTANHTFNARGEWIRIISNGEASCMALAKLAEERNFNVAVMVDERTTRMLCEMPKNLRAILESKLHTSVHAEERNFKFFSGLKIIRSSELSYIAYKKGLVGISDGKQLVDALLYAVKFKGCAISSQEIEQIKKLG